MKKKILISAVVVIMVLSMTMVMFAGCKDKEIDFGPQTIGVASPTNFETESITSDMTAYQMLKVGMNNYYDAPVAVTVYNGSVATTVIGVTINQLVESCKIRVGQGDADGNNVNGAKYFADNRSYSMAANLYEKMIITEDEVLYKNAKNGKTKYDDKKDVWTVKGGDWNSEEEYDDIAALAKAKSNNPTILWMYDLQESFVLSTSTAPSLAGEVYSFTLDFDPIKSTANYIDTMKAQLEVNAGMPVEGLEFTKLQLKVEMWSNGTIKRIQIVESYKMKLVLKALANAKLNSELTLRSDTQFAYEEVEGYKFADHLKQYNENGIR